MLFLFSNDGNYHLSLYIFSLQQRHYRRGDFSGMLAKMVGAKEKSEGSGGGWGLGRMTSKSGRLTETEDSTKLELKEPAGSALYDRILY